MPAVIILKVSKNIRRLLRVKIIIFNLIKMHIVAHRNKKASMIFYLGIKPGQGNNNSVIRNVVPHLTPRIQK